MIKVSSLVDAVEVGDDEVSCDLEIGGADGDGWVPIRVRRQSGCEILLRAHSLDLIAAIENARNQGEP